ncbi:GM14610 [Gryllus bimaculatus]|nr:GM14610 [Gryllus bimaculatus]
MLALFECFRQSRQGRFLAVGDGSIVEFVALCGRLVKKDRERRKRRNFYIRGRRMLRQIFQLARTAGGFAYYGASRRLPALYYLDFGFVALLVTTAAFATLLVLLLPVLKGRRATLALGALMLGTALAQGYARLIPEWQVGGARLRGVALSYWPGAPLRDCSLWLGVGLAGANVTLLCRAEGRAFEYYNEHLDLEEQEVALQAALLPPLQTAASTLAGPSGLFLRRAGRWASCALDASAALWAWAAVMLAALPARAGPALRHLGVSLLAAPVLYHALQQQLHPSAHALVPPRGLALRYGACFWLCVASGLAACAAGLVAEVAARRGRVCRTAFQLDTFEEQAGRRRGTRGDCGCVPELNGEWNAEGRNSRRVQRNRSTRDRCGESFLGTVPILFEFSAVKIDEVSIGRVAI